ncbi:MAG: TIGR02597 family protein, partial [Roseimicrobium sp.]
PVPVKLKDLDLISSGAFLASANTVAGQRRDELLIYDNSSATVNRAPSATYFYATSDSKWHHAAAGFPIADDVEISPSSGLLIRKYQSGSGATAVWTHAY